MAQNCFEKIKNIDIAVIGGGAAGFAAAICAAENSCDLKIAILEKGARTGRKILATGNGRCNLSNNNLLLTRYHGKDKEFALSALTEYDFDKTMNFFEKIGILTTTLEDGKVYPMSLQASSVVDMLRLRAKKLKIEEITEFEVLDIQKNGEHFIISGNEKKLLKAKKVILCTGGKAAPEFGTDGSAYSLAQKFGHNLTQVFPTLVQLKCDAKKVRALKGVKLMGNVTLLDGRKEIQKEYGEIMFTDYGLSGPPIFQLSRRASEELNKRNKNIIVKVDLLPDYRYTQIEDILLERRKNLADAESENFLNGMLNKQLAKQILKESDENLKLNMLSGKITDKTIKVLANKIKGWEFEITGTNPWKNAQVTAGGIETADIDDKTMESKKIKGLYFAGEILDIDGDCGGFNLQWAWSSGFVAGKCAAQCIGGEK
ncbi:MAG: NAD(P)/FAD-dependent oxidoreductase [Clostridia bacterium]|nr:NAD(P)/FAD-dependent oxidoreductase [Clostridia bacterium]